MKNTTKRLIGIILSALMLLSVFSCLVSCDTGSDDGNDTSAGGKNETTAGGNNDSFDSDHDADDGDEGKLPEPDDSSAADPDGNPDKETEKDPDAGDGDDPEGNKPDDNNPVEDKVFIIEGTTVTGLTEYGKTLYQLEVPEGITCLGASAFKNCKNIRKIDLPDTLITIEDSAFEGCTSLVIMVIPDSVTTVGEHAFNDTSIVSLTLGSGITTFSSSSSSRSFEVGERLLEVCNRSSIESYKYEFYPRDIKNLFTPYTGSSQIFIGEDDYVFYDSPDGLFLVGYCGSEQVITLPASCNGQSYTVYDLAFSIPGITDVTVPEGVEKIEGMAFDECCDLVNISLPDTSIYIEGYIVYDTPFYNDPDNWENGILYIGKHLVATSYNDLPAEVVVKPGTLTIASGAFSSRQSLTKVTLPEGLLRIGALAFKNCKALAEVSFPEGIQYIERDILDGTAYEKANASLSVEGSLGLYVGNYMIRVGAASGNSYRIPEGVTFIADNAMYLKESLIKLIEVPTSVKVLGKGSLYISDRLTKVYYLGTMAEWNAIDNRGCFDGFGSLGGESITITCIDGDIIYTPEV